MTGFFILGGQLGLHILNRFGCFIFIAVVISSAKLIDLIGVACLFFVLLALYYSGRSFLSYLKKLRWMFLILMIVYAFNTPGQFVEPWPFILAPTYEGLMSGCLQVTRMVTMIAALQLLLLNVRRDILIGGFYQLLAPLRKVGIPADIFAIRLGLTLDYVDHFKANPLINDFRSFLLEGHALDLTDLECQKILNIVYCPYGWRDFAMVLLGIFGVLFFFLG